MRARAMIVAVALTVLAATAAVAAPTCWDAGGRTVRCGTPGALPVGTALSQAKAAALRGRPARLSPAAWFGLACTLGGLFALIALMPDFEGWDRPGE